MRKLIQFYQQRINNLCYKIICDSVTLHVYDSFETCNSFICLVEILPKNRLIYLTDSHIRVHKNRNIW